MRFSPNLPSSAQPRGTRVSKHAQISTNHLGGLSAILHEDVNHVIWRRRLPDDALRELNALAGATTDFITLTTDPTDRLHHQLGKIRIDSRFLIMDLSLLITVFGELSNCQRVRVRLGEAGSFPEWKAPPHTPCMRLCCAYIGPGVQLPQSRTGKKPAAAISRLTKGPAAFTASTLRITSLGQVVLWKNAGTQTEKIGALPSLSDSLFLCLDQTG